MKKKLQVVMLPKVNSENCLGLIKCIKDWKSFITSKEDFNKIGDIGWGQNTSKGVFEYWQPQHLYFISDDPIQKDEYYPGNMEGFSTEWQKIIATTNPELKLPLIPQDWIKNVYVPSQGSIKEVYVEMGEKYSCSHDNCKIPDRCYQQGKPTLCEQFSKQVYKLTLNNEVVIINESTLQFHALPTPEYLHSVTEDPLKEANEEISLEIEIEKLRAEIKELKETDFVKWQKNQMFNPNLVTRLEVIDDTGRAYVRWNCRIEFSCQDDGKTLKIFVK